MKYLYRIYQLFIAAPLVALLTLLTTLLTTLGCVLGNGHFWGYYPCLLYTSDAADEPRHV